MRRQKKVKGKKKGRSLLAVLSLAATLTFGLMGAGYAAWQDGIEVRGVVSTGSIEPVFTRVVVAGESVAPGRAQALIEDQGKKLAIYVHDAYPGYYAHFRYRVTNLGTVPVVYTTAVDGAPPGVELEVTMLPQRLDGNGDWCEGDLYLRLGGVEEEQVYSFMVELNFRQWNAGY